VQKAKSGGRCRMMDVSYDKLYISSPFALANPEINRYNPRAKSQDLMI
jgi:hypothetical protein